MSSYETALVRLIEKQAGNPHLAVLAFIGHVTDSTPSESWFNPNESEDEDGFSNRIVKAQHSLLSALADGEMSPQTKFFLGMQFNFAFLRVPYVEYFGSWVSAFADLYEATPPGMMDVILLSHETAGLIGELCSAYFSSVDGSASANFQMIIQDKILELDDEAELSLVKELVRSQKSNETTSNSDTVRELSDAHAAWLSNVKNESKVEAEGRLESRRISGLKLQEDLAKAFTEACPQIMDSHLQAVFPTSGKNDGSQQGYLVFTDERVVQIRNGFTKAKLEFDFPFGELAGVQVGSSSHTVHGGFLSQGVSAWTLTLLLRGGANYTRFLMLGTNEADVNRKREFFTKKLNILANYITVDLDGSHIQSSSGFTTSFGYGVLLD